ncbi:hypothetical protein Sjap_016476 [Stephania japonica]|uniref:F-box/kelch-repeat protein n=1 Tax=Stephania japonica TaxID=461633 RepID=A0AAP0IL30_9MAGN
MSRVEESIGFSRRRYGLRSRARDFFEGANESSSNEDVVGSSDSGESQDADYSSFVPSLSDELICQIWARFPSSEYWKLGLLNRWSLDLLKGGELYRIRRDIGVKEPSVFMLASGEAHWWVCDRQFRYWRKLPILPSDECFKAGDKESLCAGTHLLVSGNQIEGVVIWKYDLVLDRWEIGPPMISPRCLFASANCGDFAFVAGGIGMGTKMEVLNSAELYNRESQTWDELPDMNKQRKLCSGCYMDRKFYVIGGQDGEGNNLTCGEFFDADRNEWKLIPDMLKDVPIATSRSPPLLAVVNNELYFLEASSNQLKVYLKKSNSWKELGKVPVRADHSRGWGIAFKSLGDELLVIGGGACYSSSSSASTGHGMKIYTCSPDPNAESLQWRILDIGSKPTSHFVLNCAVMLA